MVRFGQLLTRARKSLRFDDMNSSMPILRKLLAHAVLGMLLLFGQQQAVRHALSHATEAVQGKAQGAPAELHCNLCDGLAAFGAALPAPDAALPIAPQPARASALAAGRLAPVTGVATGYLSRAPPQPA